ncbi:hypothetical protein [Actinoplanes sp. TFC3]|uniref:hypothetical protein n=1 Tax=Actinoplanes sp. TFC3 TaxID=1710355 RepID=UPI000AC30682|nr:hypothetical protein [Actinoplanes sp. TFC3]
MCLRAFHHVAQDVASGRLAREAVPSEVVSFATSNLAVLRQIFPACKLGPRA